MINYVKNMIKNREKLNLNESFTQKKQQSDLTIMEVENEDDEMSVVNDKVVSMEDEFWTKFHELYK